jgi:hypothetical protein
MTTTTTEVNPLTPFPLTPRGSFNAFAALIFVGLFLFFMYSTTRDKNIYSMSLTRYCFIHRDYMTHYMNNLPKVILDTVATNFNCEDIAMSFMISSLTQGQPPLLADTWAMNTLLKLRVGETISGTKSHKALRDACVDSFANILGLKDEQGPHRLKLSRFVRKKDSFFECGAEVDEKMNDTYIKSKREVELEQMTTKWHKMGLSGMKKELVNLLSIAGQGAHKMGLLGTV